MDKRKPKEKTDEWQQTSCTLQKTDEHAQTHELLPWLWLMELCPCLVYMRSLYSEMTRNVSYMGSCVRTSRGCTFSGKMLVQLFCAFRLVEYKTHWNDADTVSKTAPWWPCSSALLHLPLPLFFLILWRLAAVSVALSPWAALSPLYCQKCSRM